LRSVEMYRYTVMKPYFFKDTHSESRRLRNPTFNLLRKHSITIYQQAAMLQVKLPAMENSYLSIETSPFLATDWSISFFRKVRNMVNPWENTLLKNLGRIFESQETSNTRK